MNWLGLIVGVTENRANEWPERDWVAGRLSAWE